MQINSKPKKKKKSEGKKKFIPKFNNKAKSLKFVTPVAPYIKPIPRRNTVEEKEPRIKYFRPASTALFLFLCIAIKI
jgi:hypothetical protein